jgi:hypothetical protein
MCLHGISRGNFALKGKDKAVSVHSIKAYRGRRGTAPLILKLGSINRRLYGPHSWCGCFGAVKDLLLLPGIEPWIIQPVAWSIDHLYFSDSTTVCSAAMQHCTQYHLYMAVLWENAF